MLPLLPTLALAAPCTPSTVPSDVDGYLAAAETAYWVLDEIAFEAHADAARRATACLGQPVSQALVARIHRVEGLRAWLRKDAEAASAAFSAAKWLDRGYEFPPELPADAAERLVYERVAGEPPRTEAVALPLDGTLSFDATPGPLRPVERPVVFQHLDALERPVASAWVAAGDPLPPYDLMEEEPPRRNIGPWVTGAASVGLMIGGASVFASGMYGYNLDEYQHLDDGDPAKAEYYRRHLFPRFAGGIAMMSVGTGGLVASGVWAFATPSSAGVAGRF